MPKFFLLFFALFSLGAAVASEQAAETNAPAPAIVPVVAPVIVAPVNPRLLALEKSLQSLAWPQFQAVIKAIPKLKAEVDAYGAFGWQYVKARYQSYGWRKSIAKLDSAQQEKLAGLIAQAEAGKLPLGESPRP